MRLQLIFVFFLVYLGHTRAQDVNTSYKDKKQKSSLEPDTARIRKEVEVDFLFSYYDQDGNHSAVTGGLGTEELRDYSSTILVNVPLDSTSNLGVQVGVNYYTSASTDRIDENMSSASSKDQRGQVYINYTKLLPNKRDSYSLNGGVSAESDYISFALGAAWTHESPDKNREFTISWQSFIDRWLLIFPDELRDQPEITMVPTDRRQSHSLSFTYAQVLSPRMQLLGTLEGVLQNGLLSTPFHRVFFADRELIEIERLPEHRFKVPIGLRWNYFMSENIVIRSAYRYYWDTFGIRAHTFNVELPIKFGLAFSLSPFYRYHRQSASRYFAPYREHQITDRFRTSDFDLSRTQSHKYGLGFRFSPVYGIGRFKFFSRKKVTMFKSLELRYAHYDRSDGLRANVWSLFCGFMIH